MYEYRTQTHYGPSPPEVLMPPVSGFRLRDIKCVTTSESHSHSVNDRSSAIYGPSGLSSSVMIPFTTNVNVGKGLQWIVIWERYVPEQENE